MLVRGEYIWIDGSGGLRSKTRIVEIHIENRALPITFFDIWNYDGSSTGQAQTENSEVHIKPVCVVIDPFRDTIFQDIQSPYLMKSYLVLCETFEDIQCTKPHPTNTRAQCFDIMNNFKEHKPMFGLEQEFFMIDCDTGLPLDWDGETSAGPLSEKTKDRFYCGIGAGRVSSRKLLDKVVEHALKIGLKITGTNYEVAPGQAEIQICEEGIRGADGLILLRYLLMRGFEEAGIRIDFSAKPLKGDWNGSGCHTNFSTEAMRLPGGYEAAILPAMKRLEENHAAHIECYGNDNSERLTGKHETSSVEKFSWGVADRGASVRIPTIVALNGHGYLEDRRPSGSMDPYLVTSRLVQTICTSE